MSGRAVEAAGDVDVLMLDKLERSRWAIDKRPRSPADGTTEQQLAEAAHLASLADETAEGRSIAELAKSKFGLRVETSNRSNPTSYRFSARTRMSGVSLDGHEIRKVPPKQLMHTFKQ